MTASPDHHLDLGCGSTPRNPYGRRRPCGVDLREMPAPSGVGLRVTNVVLEAILWPDWHFGRLHVLTPAHQSPAAFADPTHANFIARATHDDLCRDEALGTIYGLSNVDFIPHGCCVQHRSR